MEELSNLLDKEKETSSKLRADLESASDALASANHAGSQ
jgi:hypothetical protein